MRIATLLPLLALSLLVACDDGGETDNQVEDTYVWTTCVDGDLDGVCADDGDCDDANPDIRPGLRESCNDVDDNCNGLTDEGLSDSDQDGICDDEDIEECDGVDNDGDGLTDENFDDTDGDGVADCVDVEICDGLDNDGDGDIDEDFDVDGDGFSQCGDVDGNNVDCDDDVKAVFPGATESADKSDNDCDGLIDEGLWAAGDLVISEVMTNPNTVADPRGEWFELYNNSGRTLYLNGLTVRDSNGQNHQVATDELLQLEDGGYFVFGSNDRIDMNGRVPVDYMYDGLTLANQVDDLQILAIDHTGSGANPILIDAISWGADYPLRPGRSLTLERTHLDAESNDSADEWCWSTTQWDLGTDFGTPGDVNKECVTYDYDNDGFSEADGDCDDKDKTVYPGAPEIDPIVDNDCDGFAEQGPTMSAEIGEFSETEVCGLTYLDASATVHPKGLDIETWEWTMTSQPAKSKLTSADIHDADRSFASFEADESGKYSFSVQAWDEDDATGAPVSVSVTIDGRTDNTAPVADAGANQIAKEKAACTDLGGGKYNCNSCKDLSFKIDGKGSRDREGDSLDYLWTITSGAGVVSSRTDAATTVTVSGATPTYRGKGTSTVFLDLVVTDCMGGVSTADTIAIVYICENK